MKRALLLALLAGMLSGCDSKSKSAPSSDDSKNTTSQSFTHRWDVEMAIMVDDFSLTPKLTKMSEVVAKFGEPKVFESDKIGGETARGRVLWGCDTSLSEHAQYEMDDELMLDLWYLPFVEGDDSLLYKVEASGSSGAALSDGTALGSSLVEFIEGLTPFFESGRDIPRLEDYQKWKTDYSPLVGSIKADDGVVLSISDPLRDEILLAEKYVDTTRTYIVSKPEWILRSSAESDKIIDRLSVEIPVGRNAWHRDRETADKVHWNGVRRDRNILERCKSVLELAD